MLTICMYGGTDSGIYTQIMSADPDCGLTLKGFKQAIANYMKEHPDYVKWCKVVQELAYTKRLSVNAFGRVRILMGEENKIMRQALNSPVQGSAADVARACMPLFIQYIKDKGWYGKVKLVLQVHDEYLIEYPVALRHEVGLMCQEIMCAPLTIKGRTFKLKIDAEVGKYWGGMNGYDIDKDKVEKGSKH